MSFNWIINEYRKSFAGLPRQAWLLSLVVLINRSGTMVLFFLTLYLTSQLGFSLQLAGQMVSVYGAGSLAGALLGGWLTDRLGPARVQFASLALGGVSYILLAYLDSDWSLAVMLFTAAVLVESFRPSNTTAFAEVCPPEMRARGFALNRLAINIGVSIGPALGGFLALIDYRLIFWVDGLTCLAAAALFWFMFLRKDILHVPVRKQKATALSSPYRDGVFMTALVLLLFTGLLFTQIFNSWPLFLRNVYGLVENQIGILLAVNAVLVALIEMPVIHRLEKRKPLGVIAIGSLFLFTGFAILPLSSGFIFAVSTVIIWSIGEIMVFPLMGGFIANRADDANRGRYMGLFSFTFALSFVLGPTLGAMIYEHFGPDTLWYGFAVLGLVVFCGFESMRRYIGNRPDRIR